MEKVSLGYSEKNIPIPSIKEYETQFVEKAESFLGRANWKAWHALNPGQTSDFETFGFSTTRAPPAVPQLKDFGNDMIDLINKVKFVKKRSSFQVALKEDLNKVMRGEKLVVAADKTSNWYKVKVEDYKKAVTEEITANYKKVGREELNKTNSKAAKLVSKLNIEERVDVFAESNAFLTIKDHKATFPTRVSHRLINPAKSSVCKISKQILETVNKKVRAITKLHQWTSTAQVIQWFRQVENKQRKKFFKYDIVDFYPSISQKLFNEAITFARQYVEITDDEVELLVHCRESYLCLGADVWAKKKNSRFDVTIGAWDGAEVAELVGLLMITKVNQLFPEAGIYRARVMMA